MAADVSAITYFAPIAAFLLIFIVVFAVLAKYEVLGDSKFVNIIVGLIIASLFVSFAGLRDYVVTVVPWIAVLIIALFFILLLIAFIGKNAEFMTKGVGLIVVILLVVIFIVSAFVVFSDLSSYLPGPGFGTGESLRATIFFDWLYSARVLGAILLLVLSILVAWFLAKS